MFSALFVDDDKPLLLSLKRALRLERKEWQCHFFQNATDALEFMKTNQVDVVVSDIRMPGMNGIDFLIKVCELYPHPIRILFSGHMGQDVSLKTVNPAHQFIAKPCPIKDLIAIIERTFRYSEIFTDPSIQKIINKLDSLPVLPDIFFEVEAAIKNDSISLDKISEIIHRDPSMSAGILKTINSPFFGMSRKVQNISMAVNFLGIETLKGLILCEGIFRQFNSKRHEDYPLNLLWEHSIRVSSMVRKVARHEGMGTKDTDIAALAGLLHDLGKLLLLDQFPDKYSKVLEIINNKKISTLKAELMVFNTNHALVGAYLLGLWGFSESIVYSVAYHHDPGSCQEGYCQMLPILHAVNTFDHNFYQLNTSIFERNLDLEYLEKNGMSSHLSAWQEICSEDLEALKS